jgi:hypothetical protein
MLEAQPLKKDSASSHPLAVLQPKKKHCAVKAMVHCVARAVLIAALTLVVGGSAKNLKSFGRRQDLHMPLTEHNHPSSETYAPVLGHHNPEKDAVFGLAMYKGDYCFKYL